MFCAGPIGIDLGINWYKPARASEADMDVTLDRAFQFDVGLFAEAVLKTGDYPAVVKHTVRSRLPILTTEERTKLNGN